MPTAFTVTQGGVALRAWGWPGSTPPVLLLHGVGNYGRYWNFVADELAGAYRLIAPDARGHGDSAKPDAGYELDDFVRDAIAILDDRGIERALVVGHSMGGGHSVGLTVAHPDRVAALMLIDVGPQVMPEGAGRARRLTLERPQRFADEAEALAYLRRTSPGYSDAVYANRLAWAFDREGSALVWKSGPDSLAKIFDAGGSRRSWARLGEVRCPTTLIRGTRSNVLSAETARRVVETLPGTRLVEVDAGHNPPLERAREVADAIRELASRARA